MSGRGYPDAGDIGREYATPSSYGHQENPEHNGKSLSDLISTK
jgi:hypothetical protein